MSARVIGQALATPLGSDIERVAERWLASESAVRANPLFDATTYSSTVAASILEPVPKTPHDRILRRMGRYGYDVATRALASAGPIERGPRLGLWVGVGGLRAHWDEMMPALAKQSDDFADSWQRGLRHIHPFWMLRHLSNNTHALLAADIDARGEGITFGGASADAAAITAACDALEAGTVDTAVVVAYDSLIDPETVAARGADFVPGEAAAAMVLAGDGAGPRVTASTAAGGAGARAALIRRLDPGNTTAVFDDLPALTGELGAATAMVTAIATTARLARGEPDAASALCLSSGDPDLWAAIRLDLVDC